MKYAHLADLHLGSWRDQKMRDLSTESFLKAIDQCINNQLDFVLFAGDIFNTSLPSLDTLKIVTKKLKELKDKNIPLYVIAGSHDFSPSGKTMIDVLENAGLLINVCKGQINQETNQLQLQFTIDPKTNTKITGIIGRKGMLDKAYYQNLHLPSLEQEPGYKIFMFHTLLSELKPKHLELMESQPASFLPKGFNYYAGGHIHHPTKIDVHDYGIMTYPGALFPNNFAELEKYSYGGYYVIKVEREIQIIDWIPLKLKEHISLTHNCNHKTPQTVTEEIKEHFKNILTKDSLITIRLIGSLENGKSTDINFKEIFETISDSYFIMKNSSKLNSSEFEEIKISESDPELVEEQIIKEHLQQIKLYDYDTELHLTKSLLSTLNTTKKEGETITDFNQRVEKEIKKILLS